MSQFPSFFASWLKIQHNVRFLALTMAPDVRRPPKYFSRILAVLFVIKSLTDSQLYRLPKCIIFGEALRIRIKKLKQNLAENYSKSTKIAIRSCTFFKHFPGSMPPDPLEPFLFLNELQISSADKKIRLKAMWKLCPLPPLQILVMPLSAVYQHFSNERSKFR